VFYNFHGEREIPSFLTADATETDFKAEGYGGRNRRNGENGGREEKYATQKGMSPFRRSKPDACRREEKKVRNCTVGTNLLLEAEPWNREVNPL